MNPPELKKGTRAAVQVVPYIDGDGSTVGIVLVKERFTVDRADQRDAHERRGNSPGG